MKNNKKGQVAIFIIIAVIIVAVVALFFVLRTPDIEEEIRFEDLEPAGFMRECLRSTVYDLIDTISAQGGHLSHPNNVSNVAYLCYTETSELCVMQVASVAGKLEIEMKEGLEKEGVEYCFDEMVESYEARNYNTEESEYNDFSVRLDENGFRIDVDAIFVAEKIDERLREENFMTVYSTDVYALGRIANDIASDFAKEGKSSIGDYRDNLYEGYEIEPRDFGDNVLLYTLESGKTGETFKFAIRRITG